MIVLVDTNTAKMVSSYEPFVITKILRKTLDFPTMITAILAKEYIERTYYPVQLRIVTNDINKNLLYVK